MRLHERVLTQYVWYSSKKRLGHRQAQARGHTGRCPPTSQGEKPQKGATLSTPRSWTSILQDREKINFCCLVCFCLQYRVVASQANEHRTCKKTQRIKAEVVGVSWCSAFTLQSWECFSWVCLAHIPGHVAEVCQLERWVQISLSTLVTPHL